MSSLWELAKRHRGKLAAGATMLGGVYVAKKVWESDLLAEMKRVAYANSQDEHSSSHEVNLQQVSL